MADQPSRFLKEAQRRRDLTADIEKRNRKAAKRQKCCDIPFDIIVDKLDEHKGNVDLVSTELNIGYADLSRLITQRKELKEILLASREGLIDAAEQTLRTHVELGSLRASVYVLDTVGKNRGYVKEVAQVTDADEYNKVKAKVDLTKLNDEELRQLQGLMKKSDNSSKMIDVTPNDD